jgi:GAF domain-containing protein
LLGVLQRFVGYDLAAVLLSQEHAAFVAVGAPTARQHYDEFLAASADSIGSYGGDAVDTTALSARVAQAGGVIVDDPEELPSGPAQATMATFLSMPLRGHGGTVLGVLALSSGTPSAFGETALSTLKLIEQPAAIVIDNARMSGAHAGV